MSDNKRYYWLKLPRNFFDKHYVKMLMAKDDGVNLTLFYIRLLTESIDHEGKLRYSESIPYTNESLAQITGFPFEFVDVAMDVLKDMELIVSDDDGTIFLPKSLKMIGSESGSASRVRRYRERQKEQEKEKPADDVKPKPKAKTEKKERPEFKEIIDYFNEKAGTKYRHTTKSTQSVINARLNEKFTVDDFKKIIDIKVKSWGNDQKMRAFLRPETLFAASHFESYLNEAIAEKPVAQKQYSGLSERLAKETDAKLSYDDDGGFA